MVMQAALQVSRPPHGKQPRIESGQQRTFSLARQNGLKPHLQLLPQAPTVGALRGLNTQQRQAVNPPNQSPGTLQVLPQLLAMGS